MPLAFTQEDFLVFTLLFSLSVLRIVYGQLLICVIKSFIIPWDPFPASSPSAWNYYKHFNRDLQQLVYYLSTPTLKGNWGAVVDIRGRSYTRPLLHQNFFIFMHFAWKADQIIGWFLPHFGLEVPPTPWEMLETPLRWVMASKPLCLVCWFRRLVTSEEVTLSKLDFTQKGACDSLSVQRVNEFLLRTQDSCSVLF